MKHQKTKHHWKIENSFVDLRLSSLLGVAKALQKPGGPLLETINELFFKAYKVVRFEEECDG